MKLEQVVDFFSGPNSVELKKKFSSYETYMNEDLEYDLHQGFQTKNTSLKKSPILEAGDIVTSTMTNTTTVVSPKSAGKVISQNLSKLNFIEGGDAWYLCYVLNESKALKHQLYSTMEGSALRRVTVSNLKHLEIEWPSLEQQRQIGKLYSLMLIRERLQSEYENKLREAILEILNRKDGNGE